MTERKHILLADDEAAFRFSAGLALRIAGYRPADLVHRIHKIFCVTAS